MNENTNRYSRYFTYIKPITGIPIIKNYGSTIFTILIIIIFIFFAIKPTVETIFLLQKKLQETDEVLKKVSQKATDLTQGKKNYENLDQSIKTKIQTAVPLSVNIKSLISILEETAAQNNASISALQIQAFPLLVKDESTVGTLSEISFTFNIEGSYPKLVSILQDLKQSSRLISADNLSIRKVGDDASLLIMSISGRSYYLK